MFWIWEVKSLCSGNGRVSLSESLCSWNGRVSLSESLCSGNGRVSLSVFWERESKSVF